MFKEVSQTRLPWRFHPAPDIKRDVNRGDRHEPVRGINDRQAVWKDFRFMGNVELESRDGSLQSAYDTELVFLRRLLFLFLTSCLLLPLPGSGQTSSPRPADTPKFSFGAVLLDYEPLSERNLRQAELFYAFFAASYEKKGWGARVEVRGRDGKFRPYFGGSVWPDHALAFVKTPAGEVQVGQIPSVLGLLDETLDGNLFSVNGWTRNPEYGAALLGEKMFNYNTLSWKVRYTGQNDHVAFEEQGRNAESDSSARVREGVETRISYRINKVLLIIEPGIGGFTNRVTGPNEETRVRRLGGTADLKVAFGPVSVAGLVLYQDGDPAAALAFGQTGVPRLAYDRTVGGLFSFQAEFPTVIYRYSYSVMSYQGTGYSESLHQPSVVWMPRKGIEGTIEFDSRRLDTPVEGRRVNAFKFALGLRF